MGVKRKSLVAVSTAVLLALIAVAPAGGAVVSRDLDSSGVRAYWTPERMAEAVPLDAPVAQEPQIDLLRAAARAFDSGPVRNPGAEPYPSVGKVFLLLDGDPYSCSAAIVRAPSRSLVWTAGHCLYEPGSPIGEFATNWAFVPDYDNGRQPFGVWPASSLYVRTKWALDGNQHFDFGAAVIERKQGQDLQGAVGSALPLGVNPKYDQKWKAIGLPSGNRFHDQMWQCRSAFRRKDRLKGSGPPPLGIGCDMTGGASGGPWITGKGKLGAVTAYGRKKDHNLLYGTYLGSEAKKLYRFVRAETPSMNRR